MPSKRESIVAYVLGMYATRAAPRMRMRNFDYLPHGMTVRMLQYGGTTMIVIRAGLRTAKNAR